MVPSILDILETDMELVRVLKSYIVDTRNHINTSCTVPETHQNSDVGQTVKVRSCPD